MKIAVDAMGGDFAPEQVVKGVMLAREENPDLEFLLFGQTDQIKKYLDNDAQIEIIDAPEIITMEDEPVKAVRTKKQSSLVLAAQAVKDQKADAFFSAGNSGAVLAAGLFIVGRIKGIDRPGLTTELPVVTENNGHFVMLDVGANADTKPLNMYQYALMGEFYGQKVMGLTNPRIGLLNNGTEADKGDMNHRKVHDLLANNSTFNFVGNVESRDILNGPADVVVTDGFTGNATLKAIEGAAKAMGSMLKSAIMDNGIKAKIGGLLLKNGLNQMVSKMDYSKYGGAVLLGVKAPVVKTHGSSKADTIKNTIIQIKMIVNSGLIASLEEYIADHQAELEEIKLSTKK